MFSPSILRAVPVLLFTVFTTTLLAGSNRTAMNSIYAEGLGPGLSYSVNYERLVINDLGVRVGTSYLAFTDEAGADGFGSEKTTVGFWAFPITASYLGISAGKHALELGGGPTLFYVTATSSESTFGLKASASGMLVLGNILAGYRIHPENGGFQFRTGFAGLFGEGLKEDENGMPTTGFRPWFYLSLGGCF